MQSTLKISKSEPYALHHNRAVDNGLFIQPPTSMGSTVIQMVAAWDMYAKIHAKRYESKIGDDGVLGKEWQAIGEGLIGLLNGELGGLDAGTLDAFLRNTIRDNAVELDD